jgi:hypothetical protein
VAWDLNRLIDDTWFTGFHPYRRFLAAGASTVALTVGVVALVTIPTSAALRLTPSLQFLQLLSSLDIAFAAGTTLIGVGWWLGRKAGVVAGIAVGVVCVWSIWRYLTVVGFTADGGWLVDAGLAATMAVAFGAIHRFAGFFVFARPDEGYEYVATLAVAALTLGTLGPGAVSVDSVIGLADMLDGWVGLAIVIGGLVAGVAQLAMFWRRPLDNNESTDKKEIDA